MYVLWVRHRPTSTPSSFRAYIYSKVIFSIEGLLRLLIGWILLDDDDAPDVHHSCCIGVVCVECSFGGSSGRPLRFSHNSSWEFWRGSRRRAAKRMKYLFGKNQIITIFLGKALSPKYLKSLMLIPPSRLKSSQQHPFEFQPSQPKKKHIYLSNIAIDSLRLGSCHFLNWKLCYICYKKSFVYYVLLSLPCSSLSHFWFIPHQNECTVFQT